MNTEPEDLEDAFDDFEVDADIPAEGDRGSCILTFNSLRRSGMLWRAGWTKSSYRFIDWWRIARARGDVAGGLDEFRDRWRLCVYSATGKHIVFPFDSHEEAVVALKECPPECVEKWIGSRVERPVDWTPGRARRLPLCGETPFDRQIAELRDSQLFGSWITRDRKVEKYSNLIDVYDGVADPYDATVNACEKLCVPRSLDRLDDDPLIGKDLRRSAAAAGLDRFTQLPEDSYPYESFDAYFLGEYGVDIRVYRSELSRASEEWLRVELRRLGKAPDKSKPIKHACFVVLPDPIDPWPSGAGVYFVAANDRIKIGKAVNVDERLRSLQTSAPFKLQLVAVAPGGLKEEGDLHRQFKHLRLHGEWFRLAPELVQFVADLRRSA